MAGPARAGALIYAHSLDKLSAFYQQVLGMRLLHTSTELHVMVSADFQLLIHALPASVAASFSIAVPPVQREDQAIKLFFSVDSLAAAAERARALGGGLFGPVYAGPGFQMRNAYDLEGNVLQLREWLA
ncbi:MULTISPECIES: VOC family protein [Roseateles]|uniref:Glyoxalase/bleomycin resistance/dioxygenase family protein n=1 Tax=Roseateles albus TaxID=2987525 RepID=A0ABT5KF32_9BURK|nr:MULTISPECIES: VOC family protein [Roseateles]MCV2358239.1 glyoxalase/bleomycin resistance/dioxygenase family protein [Paucibacter sp. TC2R-5]MDC8772541.1 glyoxalase/bleomycin resistance/dioxygenase family protein [Roseateles albus]